MALDNISQEHVFIEQVYLFYIRYLLVSNNDGNVHLL